MVIARKDGRNIYLRSLVAWVVLAAAMWLNGAIRELAYQPLVGFEAGHAISCLTGIAIIFLIARLFVARHPGVSAMQWVAVGGMWLVLTVAFEFAVGRYIAGNSWEVLLADYDLLNGRLWVLVLLSTFVAPVFWERRMHSVEISPGQPRFNS